MNHDLIKIHFTSNREEIPGILKTCMEHVAEQTKDSPPSADKLSKIKWVIIELLTNAVKHSGRAHCSLFIRMEEDRLIVEKQDSGNPLSLAEQSTGKVFTWPISALAGKLEFQIYHNGTDALIVRTEDVNQACFYVEELKNAEVDDPDVLSNVMPDLLLDTSEHFGLLIVTKASDGFCYQYEPDTQINRFKCSFLLKGSPD